MAGYALLPEGMQGESTAPILGDIVASFAQKSDTNGKGAKPPISSHPAFPAIVALWFAALLGMGSLVVPVTLVETAVSVTGLSSIIPATAPPLGLTARALIALAFTVFGAITGMMIARQVAKAHSPDAFARFSKTGATPSARSPIKAHEELGAQGFDNNGSDNGNRRRSLALESEDGRSEFYHHAPLPGEMVDDYNDSDSQNDLEAEWEAEEGDSALKLLKPDPAEDEIEDAIEDDIMSDRQEFISGQNEYAAEEFLQPEMTAADVAAEDEASAELDIDSAWAEADDAEEYAPELQVFGASHDDEPAIDESMAAPEFSPEVDEKPVADEEPGAEEEAGTVQDWADAPLENLGLVQLAQRLGSSIAKNREMRATRAALAASAPIPPLAIARAFREDDLDIIEAEDVAQATQAFFGSNKASAKAELVPEADLAEPVELDEFAQFESPQAPESHDLDDAKEDIFEDEGEAEMQVFQAPEPEAQDIADPFPHFAQVRLEDDEDEDADAIDDLAASFSLPIGKMRSKSDALEPAQDDTESFGSLLKMNNPFKANAEEFVRIEDEPELAEGHAEPAVVFPSEAEPKSAYESESENSGAPLAAQMRASARPFDQPATGGSVRHASKPRPVNSEENERALREALLNLQRMSGAA